MNPSWETPPGEPLPYGKAIPNSTLDDLRLDLVAAARDHASSRNPKHVWSSLVETELLEATGLVRKDPATGQTAATLAGILIFGTNNAILEIFPHYPTQMIVRNLEAGSQKTTETAACLFESLSILEDFVARNASGKKAISTEYHARSHLAGLLPVFLEFLLYRDYDHASSARFILEKEYWSLEYARKNEKIPLLSDFFQELYPAEEYGLETPKVQERVKASFGMTPMRLQGRSFKIMALLPTAPVPVEIIENTAELVENTQKTMQASTEQAPPVATREKMATQETMQAPKVAPRRETMQAPVSRLASSTKRNVAELEWNTPKTMQVGRSSKIIEFCRTPRNREEIQLHVGMNNRDHFRKEVLNPMIEKGLLQPTIPDKPNSPKQQYVTVDA